VRQSVKRSLERLHTSYLDVVYCHDSEFVSPEEVLGAVKELRRIRDEEGTIKYVGICGYPVPVLCELAELILKETGEAIDAVQSYANFTLQNSTLETLGLARLRKAGVDVVTNASVLGMGLLRGVGVPGDWHPAPLPLRQKSAEIAEFCKAKGEKLEVVAIRWALERWARIGGVKGGVGVSVMGVSNVGELEETVRVWREVEGDLGKETVPRTKEIEELAEGVTEILGEWKDFAWGSPEEGWVDVRKVEGGA